MFDLTPVQQDLQARARDLSDTHVNARAAQIDQSESYPWDIVERLTGAGSWG